MQKQIPRRRDGGAVVWMARRRFLSQPSFGPGKRLYRTHHRRTQPGSPWAAWTVNVLQYTRFEKARIVGARALQVSMGAPPLIETPEEMRNPVDVAMMEYEADAIPLTVQRKVNA